MNRFNITVDGRDVSRLAEKSPLGVGIMVCLILHRNKPVPTEYLEKVFWGKESSSTVRGALRTLISRYRALLNDIDPELSRCLASNRGTYTWICTPDMDVDYYHVLDLLDVLGNSNVSSPKGQKLFRELLEYYTGDLLGDSPYRQEFSEEISNMRQRYRELLLNYIRVMKEKDQYTEAIDACRKSIGIFPYDDELNAVMQEALSKNNQSETAREHYKYIAQLNYNYLHMEPEAELKTLYDVSDATIDSLVRQYDQTQNELLEYDTQGAFCCEFIVFKEMYDLLVMNFSRLKNPLCLGIVMLKPEIFGNDYGRVTAEVSDFKNLMQHNLRKGDIMCQCSSTVFAVLLPTSTVENANMVMERLQNVYYMQKPEVPPCLTYRVVSLSDTYM